MTTIGASLIKSFLKEAAEVVTGDWVLTSGAVLPLLNNTSRMTLDIDLVGPPTATQKDLLRLMEVADSLDLAAESINQSSAFYLQQIENSQNHIVELHEGPSAAFYRPDVTLFILLAIRRFNEADLDACMQFVDYARKNKEKFAAAKVKAAIEDERKKGAGTGKLQRLQKLETYLHI